MEFKNEIYGSWSASKVKGRVVLSKKLLKSEKEIVTIRKKTGMRDQEQGRPKMKTLPRRVA